MALLASIVSSPRGSIDQQFSMASCSGEPERGGRIEIGVGGSKVSDGLKRLRKVTLTVENSPYVQRSRLMSNSDTYKTLFTANAKLFYTLCSEKMCQEIKLVLSTRS